MTYQSVMILVHCHMQPATGQKHFRERLNNVTTALADVDSNVKRDIKRLVTITEGQC